MRVLRLLVGWSLFHVLLGALAGAPAEPRTYRARVDPVWLGEDSFWYRNDLANDGREFVRVDLPGASRRPAFDHARVAAALSRLLAREVTARELPVEALEFPPSGGALFLHGREDSWRLDLNTYEIRDERGAAVSLPAARDSTAVRDNSIVFLNRSGADLFLHGFGGNGGTSTRHELATGARWQTTRSAGALWIVNDASGRTRALLRDPAPPLTVTIGRDETSATPGVPTVAPAATSVRSPDGRWEAIVREHNLWLRAIVGTEVFALTYDGSPGNSFRHDTSRDRLVRMQYDRPELPDTLPEVRWSPDSTHLVALQTRQVPERRVHLVESSPRDQLQPRLQSYPYLKPGDEIPTQRPRLFSVAAQREIPVDPALFANPWDLSRLSWRADSQEFTFLYNQRGHQILRLLAVSVKDGRVRPLVEEQSNTFIHYSGAAFHCELLERTQEVVWSSERSGWNHLYLFATDTGELKNAITHGEWTVRSVLRVERTARQVWFLAGGVHSGEDPYHLHLCRAELDGTGFVVLTAGDGNHDVQWSPRRKSFLDTWSRVDAPPVTQLRRAHDGALICHLETADAAEALERYGRWPERFVAKGRDGATDIHGIIQRPRDFEPTKSYPVIERIYAGPHGFHVPKVFGVRDSLVDRGFIVVQIDGMGTAGRSKAFHDVCWQNVADAGLPDRIAWIKAAAARFPGFDLQRVGIYGTSAGGQSALGALLWHGDFYRAAAADCGCHDNRMDKIWWNEQWMGWPVGPHYAANSNVTHAHLLRGKLLLAVGELDRNVDPASTYQVADALISANKEFEYLVMPGAGHGVFRTPYGRQRLEEFFVRTLQPASR